MWISALRASFRSMEMLLRCAPVEFEGLSASVRLALRGRAPKRDRVTGSEDPPESEQARGAALEALRAPLIGYFRKRVRQQEDVQDLVQEVFLRLSNRGALAEIDNLRGYTFQVAESVLMDRQRRRTVRQMDAHVELDPERMGEPELAPDRILAARMELKAAIAALEQLPERTRTIFVLRRLEGMRYLDIAKRLSLSVSAVEKHMVRAVAHLASVGDRR